MPPDNFPLDILEIIKNDKRFLPYFDIPFQSGDDSIIKAMNRHGSQNDYVELVKKIRSECEKSFYKDCAIRTTFLCGFPGETDENAENTKKFLKTIKTDWSGCFAYSKEEDTPAYSMKGQVGLKKAQKRCDQLQKVQNEIIAELLLRHVGKTYRVLIEEIVDGEAEGIAIARSWFQAPDVDGNVVLYYDLNDEKQVSCIECGKTVSATILGVSGIDLYARLCE